MAEILNLSTSTVSKSLLGHSDIGESTKNRVLELAKKMNYQPNLFGKGLRTQKTMSIGVIIPDITVHYSSLILKGIIESAKGVGYRVIISESGHHHQDEKDAINTLINSNVDGILLSIARESHDIEHILEASNFIPIVLFDKVSSKIPLTKIIDDDEFGAETAVQHLIAQGRRKIVLIREKCKTSNSENRYRGYARALSSAGLTVDDVLVRECDSMSIEDGFAVTEALIAEKIEFDGLFGATDNVAIGAIQAMKKNGITIPRDVSVIGFSNSKNSTIIEPSLSTMEQPGFNIGKYAVKYLLEEISEDSDISTNRTIELKTKLIVRDSSPI
ncbi:LacI family DNA-binding transcriptional regulator [Sediminicola sp. 1XM1-17]|uniref:LacI family DNA-binding transcriptional regulator n=1 Tax=Sediminicola sp. 1XM1-17 TaxID=3127702 RepID=UPI0030780D84